MKNSGGNSGHSLADIFRMPLWIGIISLVGLASALMGDGWLDWLSWLALGFPLWIVVRALRESTQGRGVDR